MNWLNLLTRHFPLTPLAVCSMLMASGCITVNPGPSMSLKSPQSKLQKVAFEEQVEEIPAEPKDPILLKLNYARLMEEVGRITEAREQYTWVADEEPENVDAILGLARIEMATGDYASAERNFKRVLKIDPDSAEGQIGLGQYYAARNEWNLAIEPMTKAVLTDPNNTQYRFHLAVALTHVGDVDSALPHFIRTVGDAEAHYNVALILKDQGDLEGAERHFLLAVTKKPDMKPARSWLTYLRQQRQTETLVGADENTLPTQILPAFDG